MDKHEIETFLALSEELHFGRTAERLHLSQARVSQTIKQLERRIGAPLFERTSRRVAPTPLGRRLHEGLAPVYAQLQSVVAEVTAAARGVEGVLRLGFLGSATGKLTPRILTAFGAAHPDVEIRMREVHPADPLGPLRDDEVDMLLTRLPVEEPDLRVGPVVLSERQVLAVPAGHRLARRPAVRLEELAEERTFGLTGSAPEYWWDAQTPRRTPGGREIRRGQSVGTFQEMMTLIAAGQGVSPVAASVCCFYARPDVVFVPLEDAPPTEVALVWRAAGETEKHRAFLRATCRVVTENGGPADS
ncbi:LysR family transcriptional regulator [Actinomadura kijaniata]|uniref:LysR family transcriptional regulator n=1 Tax=Actinomadura kijaniata TaxID=46161 RepID=UPI003F1C0607